MSLPQIPHIFSYRDPAKATFFNENFQYIESFLEGKLSGDNCADACFDSSLIQDGTIEGTNFADNAIQIDHIIAASVSSDIIDYDQIIGEHTYPVLASASNWGALRAPLANEVFPAFYIGSTRRVGVGGITSLPSPDYLSNGWHMAIDTPFYAWSDILVGGNPGFSDNDISTASIFAGMEYTTATSNIGWENLFSIRVVDANSVGVKFRITNYMSDAGTSHWPQSLPVPACYIGVLLMTYARAIERT